MVLDKLLWRLILGGGIVFFLVSFSCAVSSPPVKNIDMSIQVEDRAAQQKVDVVRESSFEYKFVESEGLGGSGGQGGVLSQRSSAESLVEMARTKNATIHYVMSANRNEAEKFYWVYAEGTYFYWKDIYPLPSAYTIRSATNAQLVLEKNLLMGLINSVIIGFAGMVVTFLGVGAFYMFNERVLKN